ncbi:bifunctional riboflavin kinase/FAD synthetase [Piscirickettsia litoralis]|uniref:Riboflavin biosynthesis protein n=1 Tax=Piscirickettsia litoralis TaxID=1891921 RepID=A0ABX3A2Q2_9GAMM|nr:bifunctional riboflavin kinase/FAD synthetase [Piscirickettsia litoralis]ODN42723.1 riboflavin biosynthesis protein RibF [Piscirickettsia litoralis]
MKVLRDRRGQCQFPSGVVATIGNFDGVHLGHQSVLAQLKAHAERLGLPAVVIIFEPQPAEFFLQNEAPRRLTPLRDKLLALSDEKIDAVLCLSFDASFAELTAEEFIQNILLDQLNVKHVVIGDDFRFGKGRQGDFALLSKRGAENNFTASPVVTLSQNAKRVSSTGIRQALDESDFDQAKLLLGRAYQLNGRVIHGDKRGRTIGFPTANIALKRPSILHGVYVVSCQVQGKTVCGVANVGQRPTVGGTRWLLEVNLFDFQHEIYGEHITVEFLARLRGEQRFESFAELKAQILNDVEKAKAFFQAEIRLD